MPIAANIYYHAHLGGEEGVRPPVVLIHGAGGTHLYWPSELRRLPGQRVFALDLPGHGKSGGRGQQSVEAYGEAVVEWLTQVNLHRAVFVGHSMGSAIALSLALNYPEHVLGLGLLGAGARLHVSPDLLDATANPTTFHSAIETIVQWSFSPETPAQLTELAARRMAETRPSVLHSDFLACQGFDETARLSQVSQPTLVICGTEDRMTPLRLSQFLTGVIPHAQLQIIANAGHMVMLEQPAQVASRLSDFLVSIPFS